MNYAQALEMESHARKLLSASVDGSAGLRFSPRDFVLDPVRPPSQTGRMTIKKLTALISHGYGLQHGHLYKPWLRVTRGDSSPCSTVGHLPDAELLRIHHYRSKAECSVLLLTKWLGALDARDQYPLWPWEHPHPLVGLPDVRHSTLPGLLEVANHLNIQHGTYVGTSLPYVASMDVMATWPCARFGVRLVAYDCKPKSLLDASPPGSRMRQRLVLHRRYCVEAKILHRPTHGELIQSTLITNLNALFPAIRPGRLEALKTSVNVCRMLESIRRQGYDMPVFEALEAAASRFGVDLVTARQALHRALWTQEIDHDLSRPLELFSPLRPGGVVLKARLLKEWT